MVNDVLVLCYTFYCSWGTKVPPPPKGVAPKGQEWLGRGLKNSSGYRQGTAESAQCSLRNLVNSFTVKSFPRQLLKMNFSPFHTLLSQQKWFTFQEGWRNVALVLQMLQCWCKPKHSTPCRIGLDWIKLDLFHQDPVKVQKERGRLDEGDEVPCPHCCTPYIGIVQPSIQVAWRKEVSHE